MLAELDYAYNITRDTTQAGVDAFVSEVKGMRYLLLLSQCLFGSLWSGVADDNVYGCISFWFIGVSGYCPHFDSIFDSLDSSFGIGSPSLAASRADLSTVSQAYFDGDFHYRIGGGAS
ncbi:unnamed protein product [Prorocentrum cordatum]|uniref:Uncharacterized protein n=1 Tax=Prorocentrum cordatum TaxID=2364126 RepID=A0ABN9YEZ3_9DINO|nr:unnamed protein product [Polarella glacialis]